ncbi:MAG: CobW family GTP-binding protein [Polyangia bacterium]
MGRTSPFVSLDEDERRRLAVLDRPPVPFVVLTGFLGAGKTTLLNRLLAAPGGRRVAVLVNDVGRINIDRQLITADDGDLIELSGGCVCCKLDLQRDLFTGIDDLVERARPDVVLLETTGIADPGVLMAAFDELETRRKRVTPSGVVCVIDSEVGLSGEARPEWRAQVDASDAFVLSKIDRATSREVEALHARLAQLRPSAERAAFPPGDAATRSIADFLFQPRHGSKRSHAHAHSQLTVHALSEPGRFLGAPLLALVEAFGPELLRVKGHAQLADGTWGYLERAGLVTSLTASVAPASLRTELVFIFDDEGAPSEQALRRQLWALAVHPGTP